MQRVLGPRRLSAGAGLLLSIVLAGESVASSWNAPVFIAGSFLDGLVGLDNSTAVLVYPGWAEGMDNYAVTIRRTTDAGATWQSPVVLGSGYPTAIAGLGRDVDVVWQDDDKIRYARSTDGGASFRSPVAVADGYWPSVGRGANGLVAIAYGTRHAIKVRISADGGRHFGAPSRVAARPGYALDDRLFVAAGDGVVYVGFMDEAKYFVATTPNVGVSWRTTLVGTRKDTWTGRYFGIAASGDDAYYSFIASNGTVRYRRTSDAGRSWQPEVRLTVHDRRGEAPNMSIADGVVRAVYGAQNGLFYRESRDGATWSPAEHVSAVGYEGRVAFAGRVIVAYNTWIDGIHARTRDE